MGRPRELIGDRVALGIAKANGGSAVRGDGPAHLQLQGVAGGVKDMDPHIPEGATAVIHQFSPISGMVKAFLIRPFLAGPHPKVPAELWGHRVLPLGKWPIIAPVFWGPGMDGMYLADDSGLDQ